MRGQVPAYGPPLERSVSTWAAPQMGATPRVMSAHRADGSTIKLREQIRNDNIKHRSTERRHYPESGNREQARGHRPEDRQVREIGAAAAVGVWAADAR